MLQDNFLSLFTIYFLIAVTAAVHVLLYKRDSRSAFGWLGLILLFPLGGAILYTLFGVNRVQRKARRSLLRVDPEGGRRLPVKAAEGDARLDLVGFNVTGHPLLAGNEMSTFFDGEQAFPAMLQAIDGARREVLLSSYIFDRDDTGRRFIEHLAAARDRGVDVRILVDDVGIRYSFPTITGLLRQNRLNYRRFMPLRLFPPSLSINLRTHRKLLITDRRTAFAGGMNIGDRQLVAGPSKYRASDLQFGFEGPVVADLVHLFGEDWVFCGGDVLQNLEPNLNPVGAARCRVVPDGPDETLDSLLHLVMGVISSARRRAWIMTPYFLPDRMMSGCLQAAALSGVDIRVMIPQLNNWAVVSWALQHNMAELLQAGVQIVQRPPPFAHSKCMIIDDNYAMVGSHNLDPRSLRLNFEVGIEVFNPALNRTLSAHFEELFSQCIPYTRQSLACRSLPARLRDAASALFAPYL